MLPLFDNVIAPVKLLLAPLVVKSIALAPALKLDVPGTVNVPVRVIAPFEVIDKLRPIVDAASTVAILLFTLTSLAPLFDKVIAPVKLFAAPKVIA